MKNKKIKIELKEIMTDKSSLNKNFKSAPLYLFDKL